MRVHVDQTGQQRGVRQIDRCVSRSLLNIAGRRDLRNLVAFDHDGLIRAQLSGTHIQHAPRANYRPLRGGRLRAGLERDPGQNRQNGRQSRSPSADFPTCCCVRP